MNLKWIAALLLLSACSSIHEHYDPQAPQATAHQVYLVRHAEKLTGDNPSLSAAGERRAETLADLLSDKGLTHIHSTDYNRTLETVAPIAAQTGLPVVLYDPRDLAGFAEKLNLTPGTHLVVGHSNTTPQLAQALGGDPGPEIDEASEYDRLYIVTFGVDGVSSELQRYGERYQSDDLPVAAE